MIGAQLLKWKKHSIYALSDQKIHLNNVFIISTYIEKQDKSKYKTIYTQKITLEVNATKRSTSVYSGQKGPNFSSFYNFFLELKNHIHHSSCKRKHSFPHHLHHYTYPIFNILSPHPVYRAR